MVANRAVTVRDGVKSRYLWPDGKQDDADKGLTGCNKSFITWNSILVYHLERYELNKYLYQVLLLYIRVYVRFSTSE